MYMIIIGEFTDRLPPHAPIVTVREDSCVIHAEDMAILIHIILPLLSTKNCQVFFEMIEI